MRCLISLALGLLALEVALALEPVFTSAEPMCPDARSEKDPMPCVSNCLKNQDCEGNTLCCPSSCGFTCKAPINLDVPKAGRCPWNSPLISSESCLINNECTRDSDCQDNKKCCNVQGCMQCTNPEAEESRQ